MCTATWIRTREGYQVFFNRDELRTRAPALPPSLQERDGVRFVAPTDGEAAGTWLGVNERGVTIGLANGAGRGIEEDRGSFRSRGLLVLDLLASTGVEEAGERLAAIGGSSYRPFELFAIGPRGEGRLWRWDGREIASMEVPGEGTLLISSSRDPGRARIEREALLERLLRERGRIDEHLLATFQASHQPERGAWSPCMHREDASTVSESRIRVGEREVEFAYRPGPPCEGARRVEKRIPRRTSA